MAAASATPGLEQKARSLLDLIKDTLAILRDLFLFVLIILLIFRPGWMNSMLQRAGISEVNAFGVDWKARMESAAKQNLSAGSETTNATTGLQEVKASLQQIADGHDPAAAAKARQALETLNGSIASLDSANRTIASSYLTQQTLLDSTVQTQPSTAKAAPATAVPNAGNATGLEGWVYIGEADSDHQRWVTPPVQKISASTPALKVGDTVTFTDDLFVRADKVAGQIFNQAQTLGVVRTGTNARVLEIRPSHALNGGDFLWIKVQVAQ